MGTFLVGVVLVVVVVAIIRKLIKDKKEGKGCSGNCNCCGDRCKH